MKLTRRRRRQLAIEAAAEVTREGKRPKADKWLGEIVMPLPPRQGGKPPEMTDVEEQHRLLRINLERLAAFRRDRIEAKHSFNHKDH